MMNEKIANLLLTLIRNKREDFDFSEDREIAYLRKGNASAAVELIRDEDDEEDHFYALLTVQGENRSFNIPMNTILGETCRELFAFLKAKQEDEQEMKDAKFIDKFRKALN